MPARTGSLTRGIPSHSLFMPFRARLIYRALPAPAQAPLGEESTSMRLDRRPSQRSRPARLTRRDALGLAAAAAVGGLATAAAHTTAAAGPQEAPWAAALTAAIDTLLPRT